MSCGQTVLSRHSEHFWRLKPVLVSRQLSVRAPYRSLADTKIGLLEGKGVDLSQVPHAMAGRH